MAGDQLGDLPVFQQPVHPHIRLVGIVFDDGQALLALPHQFPDQAERGAGHAEATQHDAGAIGDLRNDRLNGAGLVGQRHQRFTDRPISAAIASRLSIRISMISLT